MRNIIILIFYFFVFINPIQSQEKVEENFPESKDNSSQSVGKSGDRYGVLNLRKKNGPNYISLYPGVTYGFSEMIIKSQLGKADMAADLSIEKNIDFLMDLKSVDFQISENFGFTILGRAKPFLISRQRYEGDLSFFESGSNSSSNSSSSGSSGSGSGSGSSSADTQISNEDIGTRVSGNYAFFAPAFYIGKEGIDHVRVGLGVGGGQIRFSGNANFQNTFLDILPLTFGNRPGGFDNYANLVGRVSLLNEQNFTGDPVRSFLLANLGQGENLQNLGLYMAAKGEIDLKNINHNQFFISYLMFQDVTLIELLAISSISRGTVSAKQTYFVPVVLFAEYPTSFVNFRLTVMYSSFKAGNNHHNFNSLEIAAYLPIDL
ncbi:hypothetical protein [Leptospira vanthielii]|uniref:Porin n=2 Tax=Leptospira vanthielii TaxID=293085 RepID=A0ABY2NNL6_9LEPT|nr:hypothetical protein [Leptospira vanthielii]TGM53748.1 hypothetical protein EHQ95_10060 [Leptospira vanthielii]